MFNKLNKKTIRSVLEAALGTVVGAFFAWPFYYFPVVTPHVSDSWGRCCTILFFVLGWVVIFIVFYGTVRGISKIDSG